MITLASKEAGTHGRTKHFTGRINYLIDNVKNGIIRLEYLRTDAQHADGLTKPFGPKAMKRFQQQMLGTQLHGIMAKKVRTVWSFWGQDKRATKKHRVTFAKGTKEDWEEYRMSNLLTNSGGVKLYIYYWSRLSTDTLHSCLNHTSLVLTYIEENGAYSQCFVGHHCYWSMYGLTECQYICVEGAA